MDNDTPAHRLAFYLLKKYSSYTWLNEIFRYTKQFAEQFEALLRDPPASFGPPARDDEIFLHACWNACGALEGGLELIRQGNKLFGYTKFGDGHGFADDSLRGNLDRAPPRRYISNDRTGQKYRLLGYSDDERVGEKYVVSTGIFELLERAALFQDYVGYTISVKKDCLWQHPERLENVRWPQPILSSEREAAYGLPRWYPTPLPAVPTPVNDVPAITTGDEIPITGIWQPEPLKPMDRTELRAWDVVSENYCMNFLIQGNTAPEAWSQELEESWFCVGARHRYDKRPQGDRVYRKLRWRLIWRDERYGENGIPEAEKDYLRTDPPAELPDASEVTRRIPAGMPCTRSGFWFSPARASTRRWFKEGEITPKLDTDYGDTFWLWDPDQSPPKL